MNLSDAQPSQGPCCNAAFCLCCVLQEAPNPSQHQRKCQNTDQGVLPVWPVWRGWVELASCCDLWWLLQGSSRHWQELQVVLKSLFLFSFSTLFLHTGLLSNMLITPPLFHLVQLPDPHAPAVSAPLGESLEVNTFSTRRQSLSLWVDLVSTHHLLSLSQWQSAVCVTAHLPLGNPTSARVQPGGKIWRSW